MKTLEEVIYRVAEIMLHEYLGGGNRRLDELSDIPLIAFIYDVEADDLYEEISNTYAELLNYHTTDN